MPAEFCKKNREKILWVCIMLGGFAFLLHGNTHEGIWFDESLSAAYASHSFKEILQLLSWDSHPPLYYFLLSLVRRIFGGSLFALRSFSALGIAALASLGIGPVRQIFGMKTGIVFSFIVFTTPICLAYGQEIRMYSWSAFFVLGYTLFGYLAVVRKKTTDWILFGIFLLLSAYTHFYALLAAGITGILIFVWILVIKDAKSVKMFVIIVGTAAILYLPWFIHLVKFFIEGQGISWIPEMDMDLFISTLCFPYSSKFSPPDPQLAFPTYFYVMTLVAVSLYQLAKAREKTAMEVIIPFSGYLLTIVISVLISIFIRPCFIPRYSLPVLGLFLLTVAYTFSRYPKYITAIACSILLLFSVNQLAVIKNNQFNGPMNEVASYIRSNMEDGDVFLHTSMHTMGTFWFYFPENDSFLFSPEAEENYPDLLFSPNVTVGPDYDEFLNDKKKIWLVTCINSSEASISASLLRSGEFEVIGNAKSFVLPNSWYAISVCKVQYRKRQ